MDFCKDWYFSNRESSCNRRWYRWTNGWVLVRDFVSLLSHNLLLCKGEGAGTPSVYWPVVSNLSVQISQLKTAHNPSQNFNGARCRVYLIEFKHLTVRIHWQNKFKIEMHQMFNHCFVFARRIIAISTVFVSSYTHMSLHEMLYVRRYPLPHTLATLDSKKINMFLSSAAFSKSQISVHAWTILMQ